MKKLAFILALAGMLVGCNKNADVTKKEMTIKQTDISTEPQPVTATEKEPIAWHPICTEFESISVEINSKTTTYKIAETREETYVPDLDKIKKYLKMTINSAVKIKELENSMEDSIRHADSVFLEFENAIAQNVDIDNSESTIMYDKIVKIDNQPFLESISLKSPCENTVSVWITYLTTTPKNKIEISFYYEGDPLKGNFTYNIAQEAPQYFEQYGNGPFGWKDEESVGLLAKNLANGKSESQTLNRLYDSVKQIVSKIKINIKE
ncbi:hypothetical protein [Treponema pedis]|uniref:hypothetical protein n=1 Tax=Treponema pedis TaxID=409322 RepID=UPI0003FD8E86|nr:hypothetical protein [Treponema pedis]